MSKYIIDSNTLTDIADAIREEGFVITEHPEIATEDMADRIRTLQTGGVEINENGQLSVKGLAYVDVNVPQGVFPSGDIDITENGTYDVTNFVNAIVNVAGGGGEFPDNFLYEKVTVTEDTTRLTVPHNRGVAPYFAVVLATDMERRTIYQNMMVLSFGGSTGGAQSYTTSTGAIGGITAANFTYANEVTDDHVTFGGRWNYRAGYDYHVIMVF